MPPKRKSTRQLLLKLSGIPSLYRHSVSGTYYGQKKFHGRRKEHSLGTTDRKLAERRLKEWIKNLEQIDSEAERMTLTGLIQKFEEASRGKASKTRQTNASIIK